MSSATAKLPDPSMEEILASIRRIIADDHDGLRPVAIQTATGRPPHERERAADPVGEPEETEPDFRAEPRDLAATEIEYAPAPLPDEADGPVDPLPALEPVAATLAAVEPQAAAEPHRPESLVSRETTATVGQAFGLLSHTVLTHNSQTLEDLVTAMLKPMLRTWLDDNLPPLVERLVRAEIERVARGGR